MTIHGTYAVFPLILSRTARWLSVRAYRRANRILSVSNFTRSTLQQREPTLWNEIGNKVQVLGNGLDLSDIPSPSTHPRHRSARVPASILAVGAVKERKGTLEAIDACATYKQTYHHPFRFDIIGSLDHDPDYVREVRRRISQHGLQDEVRLRGRLSDALLKATYRSADLFLLLSSQSPNNFEGFGLVFLEASAQGIPVIGPTTGGCPEAIKEGKSGYICNPSDAKSIASRMHAILQEHAIKPQECRSWAESHDIHTRAETLERHYEELMKSE
jgi:glycosyltransferase involved in cell wall biosynthesis